LTGATLTHPKVNLDVSSCASGLRLELKIVRTSRNRCQVDSADRLLGGEGRNNLYGEDGNDTLVVQLYGEAKVDVASVFSGGNGTDTLHGDVDGTIRNDDGYGILVDATFSIGFSDKTAGSGWFGYSDRSENWVEGYTARGGGTFTGIEKVTVEPDTVLEYGGGASNVTMVGGNLHDYFRGGSGNETFIGGKGDDLFHFGGRHAHGSDKIVGYSAAEGDMVTMSWDPEGWHSQANVSVVEKNGHTIITSSETNGTVFHVLDIDAVNVNFTAGWIWG
jgi:hypothetical protein